MPFETVPEEDDEIACDHDWKLIMDSACGEGGSPTQHWEYFECRKCGETKDADPANISDEGRYEE